MSNHKHALTINLDLDDGFNKEVNELIRAKVVESIRANCQSIVDHAINDAVPRIVSKRIEEVPQYVVNQTINDAVEMYLKSGDGRKLIDESTQLKLSKCVNVDLAIDRAVSNWVDRKLNRLVTDDVIQSVVKSILSAADK